MTRAYTSQEIDSWPFFADREHWSRLLGVSYKLLYRAEKDNLLTPYKEGRDTYYLRSGILNLLDCRNDNKNNQ